MLNRFRMRDYVDDVVSVLETLERRRCSWVTRWGCRRPGPARTRGRTALAGAALLATVPSSGVAGLGAGRAARPWQFVRASLTWNLGVLVEQATDVRHLFFGPDLSDADRRHQPARLHSSPLPGVPRPAGARPTPSEAGRHAGSRARGLARHDLHAGGAGQTAAAWGADLVVIEGSHTT
ncbi:MAG: hypothetical protein R3F61_29750 [Myxococcota bacterium]